jgi:acyl-CoA synthetase (AMP-forming)/AMP-acid ligase II
MGNNNFNNLKNQKVIIHISFVFADELVLSQVMIAVIILIIMLSDTFVLKNLWATKQALDEDGWLSTGDIGWIAPHHSTGRSRRCSSVVVLEGRAKDTIVLSTGIPKA